MTEFPPGVTHNEKELMDDWDGSLEQFCRLGGVVTEASMPCAEITETFAGEDICQPCALRMTVLWPHIQLLCIESAAITQIVLRACGRMPTTGC
jgi:hypothetical protein